MSLYAVSFALLLVAGAVLVVASWGRLASTRLLSVSTALSAAAIVAAVISVVLPRRG